MPAKIISFERAKDPLIEAKKTEKLKAMQAAFETARTEAGVSGKKSRPSARKKSGKKGKPKSKR